MDQPDCWRETSIGELGNFGPHSMNLAFMSLRVCDLWNRQAGEKRSPIQVKSECSEVNQLSYPSWERIRWEVPARGDLAPLTITWHHGHKPDYAKGSRNELGKILLDHGATEGELGMLLPNAGCMILGSKGVMVLNSHNGKILALLPRDKFDGVDRKQPRKMPKSPGHYVEWVEACQGSGVKPISNFEYSAPFAEFLNVGSLSTRFPGEELEFDPVSGKIGNHSGAASFLSYEYREGWTI